jgi:CHAT domain-containing protein
VGAGNPLPTLDTARWVLRTLQKLVPKLEGHFTQADADALGNEAEVTSLQRESIACLKELSAGPAEAVSRTGRDLARAAERLANNAPEDISAVLWELATRIPADLPHADSELREIADMLPSDESTTFYEEGATRERLWEALPTATLLHLACHGHFDPSAPRRSALTFAGGSRLSLGELLQSNPNRMDQLQLVFLSACQTAVTDFNDLPDEVLGLPAGFLQSGVPAVIGTLWPVGDRSTALLVTRFWEYYLHGNVGAGIAPGQSAGALQSAQTWLRELTFKGIVDYLRRHEQLGGSASGENGPKVSSSLSESFAEAKRKVRQGREEVRPYEHPYYWASFVHYGKG